MNAMEKSKGLAVSIAGRSARLPLAKVAAGLLLAVGATQVNADFITFDLGTSNLGSGFTGPFVSVEVNRTSSTTATLTFDSLSNGGYLYLMGDGGSVAFNVNATSWFLNSITGTNSLPGFHPGPYSDGGSGNEDGFGSFNQKINDKGGFTFAADEVVVSLTDTSGTWATASDVLAANSEGNLAAAHIFACLEPCTVDEGATATGFASNTSSSTTSTTSSTTGGASGTAPEPGTLSLLGGAILGGLFQHRRRRQAKA